MAETNKQSDIQRLAQLKKFLEEKIEALEKETENLKVITQIVDRELAGRSFRRGTGEPVAPIVQPVRPVPPTPVTVAGPVPPPPKPVPVVEERRRELVYRGRAVGNAYVSLNRVRIAPEEKLRLRTSTPPFESFFLRKVLDEIRETDTDRAGKGEIRPDQILSYDVVEENRLLKQIVVKNYNSSDRLNRLLRAAAWTFMVMGQK